MIIHNVEQGSAEWHALRDNHDTASEAPVMAAQSKLQTRQQLLDVKKTGLTKEVGFFTQRIFDKGHAVEALARVIVEEMLGEDLFPIVVTEGRYLASMDGANVLIDTLFEHKQWNEELAAAVRAKDLDPQYWIQLEQQLFVSKAERVIFVCSDGTKDKFEWMEYRPVPGRWEQIEDGWNQFNIDLATHVVTEVKAKEVADVITALPPLSVMLSGEVKSSNLTVYKDFALRFVEGINTDLQTDKDFVNAEAAVKFCDGAEKELELVKKAALAQTATIDELFTTIDTLKEAMRKKRLELSKLVETRKTAIRDEFKQKANDELGKHIEALNNNLRTVRLPSITADFAGAMKGKRNLDSLKNAIDGVMIQAKGEATRIAGLYAENLTTLETMSQGYEQLFTDVQQLVTKANDDLVLLINSRIDEHKRVEQARKDEIEATAKRLQQEREDREREASQATCSFPADDTAEAPAAQTSMNLESPGLGNPGRSTASRPARMSTAAHPAALASANQTIAPVATKMVSIPESEYRRLKACEDKLNALMNNGVDNWDGYSDAMSELEAA